MRYELIIMRHGEALESRAFSDHERPLTEHGFNEVVQTTQAFSEAGLRPDLLLVSDAKRTKESATLVQENLSGIGDVRVSSRLYLASYLTLVEELSSLEPTSPCVMIIGHNPGLSELIYQLSGGSADLGTADAIRLETHARDWAEAAYLSGLWKLTKSWRSA